MHCDVTAAAASRTDMMNEMKWPVEAAARGSRRLSLPHVSREPVSRNASAQQALTSAQRRGSLCVHTVQSNTVDTHHHQRAAAAAAAEADADKLMLELHKCRNELSQLLIAVSQLEVRNNDTSLCSLSCTNSTS